MKYKFSNFQELVDRVPSQRIRDCLDKLGEKLDESKFHAELEWGIESLRSQFGTNGEIPVTFPNPAKVPSRILILPPYFEYEVNGGESSVDIKSIHFVKFTPKEKSEQMTIPGCEGL